MLHILPVIEIPTRKLNSSGNGKLSQARAINRKKKEKKQGRRSTVRAPSRRAKGASCKPQERERERERGKRGRESSADSRPIINKKESFREQGPGMSNKRENGDRSLASHLFLSFSLSLSLSLSLFFLFQI